METPETVVVRTPRLLRLTVPVVVGLTAVGLVTLAGPAPRVVAVVIAVWWVRMATCWVAADRQQLEVRNTFGRRTIAWAQVEGWVVRPGHVDVVVAGRSVTVDALRRTGLGRGAQAKGEAAVRMLTRPRRGPEGSTAASGAE